MASCPLGEAVLPARRNGVVCPLLTSGEKYSAVGADLKGVDVYVLGIDAATKAPAYWDSLRRFWTEYFKKSGADLRAYSMMREVPDFGR